MRVLFLGDIVGKPGRDAVCEHLPLLRQEYTPELIIANGENAAAGFGITEAIVRTLLEQGVDVITTGNHVWAKTEELEVLDTEPRLLRPANYPLETPGRGYGIFRTKQGNLIGVANLMGRALMAPLDDPFRTVDEIITLVHQQTPLLFVDFHAEATSEKVAFGWHCAGRVSAVIGTHTHVPTADEKILPGGTAYLTDAGMCGPEHSVIGMEIASSLARFRTGMPHRFRVAEGSASVNGVVVDLDPSSGKALRIERIKKKSQ
jgi:2',3'-cyclic-nucleotide 2'-phosphodiesterase